MKITKLLNSNLVPHFTSDIKCGALPVAPFIEGAFGILGGGLNAVTQSDINSQNIANSFLLAQYNNQFNAEESAKNRRWQANEYDRRFYKESAEWYNQQEFASDLSQLTFERQQETAYQYWKQQQEYMSPLNQLQRFNQAGLNGAALISGQQFGGTGLSSAPSSPAPTVPSPSPTGSAATSSGGSMAQAINPMSNFIDSIVKVAQASEHSAHAKEMWDLIQPQIEELVSRSKMQQSITDINDMEAYIKGAKLPKELEIQAQEYLKLIADTALSAQMGGYYNESRLLQMEYAFTESVKRSNLDANTKYVLAQIPWIDRVNRSIVNRNQSEVEKNKAMAAYSSALAETENALRDGKVTALDLSNRLSELSRQSATIDLRVSAATEQDRIRGIIGQCEAQGLLPDEMRAKIERMEKENNWYEVQQVMNCLGQAMSMYTGLKGVQISQFSAEQRADIQREFNRIYEFDVQQRNNYDYDFYPTGNGGYHQERHGWSTPWNP